MIFSAFINVIFYIINLGMSELPTVDTSSGFGLSISNASGEISGLFSFIPLIVTNLLAILAFDLIFEGGYLAFKIFYWVLRRFPTQS
jgi:hypothetical protein